MFVLSSGNYHPTNDLMTSLSREAPENKLLAALPAAERERLAPYLKPVDLHFGQRLVEFDYPIKDVYFLVTAVTSTLVNTPHGETIEAGSMGADGFVGLSLLYGIEQSNGTVVVQVPGQALKMTAADFLKHVKEVGGPCL